MPAARLFAFELRRWEAQLENSINRYAIALGLAMLDRAKRASHIDPPASSYAIMQRACPYRGENPVPGKDVRGELDPTPGIRERPRPISDMRCAFLLRCTPQTSAKSRLDGYAETTYMPIRLIPTAYRRLCDVKVEEGGNRSAHA